MNIDNIKDTIGGITGTMISALGATMALSEIQALISIIVTIIGFIITLVTTIVIPLIKNFKKAKEDGKVTPEELDKIKNDLNNGLEELNKLKGDRK